MVPVSISGLAATSKRPNRNAALRALRRIARVIWPLLEPCRTLFDLGHACSDLGHHRETPHGKGARRPVLRRGRHRSRRGRDRVEHDAALGCPRADHCDSNTRRYALTDTGRAVLGVLLERSGVKLAE